MRVTFVANDNLVVVDGVGRPIDLSGLDPAIRIVQWDSDTNRGWLEFKPQNPPRYNEDITDFAPYQQYFDAWEMNDEAGDDMAGFAGPTLNEML
jgi:hypothetical protein